MIKGAKSNIKTKLENINIFQQLLQSYKDEMFETIELQYEIRNGINNKIAKIFDDWIKDIENDINKIDKELTFILGCINQLKDSEDKKIIIELYVNQKTIEDIENELGIEHDLLIEILKGIYSKLKKIMIVNKVNNEL